MTETPTPLPACPFCGGEGNQELLPWEEVIDKDCRCFAASPAAWSRRVTPDAGVREALVAKLKEDFEQFESVCLPGRDNGAHPDWLTCNRIWRLFDTVARRVESAALASTPPQVKTDAGAWRTMESAPRDGTEIIACWPQQGNTMQLVSWSTVYKSWSSKGSALCVMQATHWQPLPSPPQVSP